MDGLFYFLLSVFFSKMLAIPHAHQLKNFIMPPKQKNCPFSPEDVNFLVLEYLFVLAWFWCGSTPTIDNKNLWVGEMIPAYLPILLNDQNKYEHASIISNCKLVGYTYKKVDFTLLTVWKSTFK